MKSERTPDAHEQRGSSMLRAFAVLEQIAVAEEPPTLEVVTHTSGFPKPTVYRILQLLAQGGLVQREISGKRYVIGPRLAAVALSVQQHSPQRYERRAILQRLVEEIGETCNLTILDGNEVLYLDRVETSASVRLHLQAGSRVPLHCTASGKLLLSNLPPARVRLLLGSGPLKAYTGRTITDVRALERELDRIRTNRVSTDSGEYLSDSVCVAMPVCDDRGRICAAIAVHGPAPRMTLKKGYAFLPAMRRAAKTMASTLLSPAIAHAALGPQPQGQP